MMLKRRGASASFFFYRHGHLPHATLPALSLPSSPTIQPPIHKPNHGSCTAIRLPVWLRTFPRPDEHRRHPTLRPANWNPTTFDKQIRRTDPVFVRGTGRETWLCSYGSPKVHNALLGLLLKAP